MNAQKKKELIRTFGFGLFLLFLLLILGCGIALGYGWGKLEGLGEGWNNGYDSAKNLCLEFTGKVLR